MEAKYIHNYKKNLWTLTYLYKLIYSNENKLLMLFFFFFFFFFLIKFCLITYLLIWILKWCFTKRKWHGSIYCCKLVNQILGDKEKVDFLLFPHCFFILYNHSITLFQVYKICNQEKLSSSFFVYYYLK